MLLILTIPIHALEPLDPIGLLSLARFQKRFGKIAKASITIILGLRFHFETLPYLLPALPEGIGRA